MQQLTPLLELAPKESDLAAPVSTAQTSTVRASKAVRIASIKGKATARAACSEGKRLPVQLR
jgi:hypothetical protein